MWRKFRNVCDIKKARTARSAANGRMPTSRLADVSRCESFCHPGFLVLLPPIAGRFARPGGQEFRLIATRSAAPVVTIEKVRRVLVGAGGLALPCFGKGPRRRVGLVLDRTPKRLRTIANGLSVSQSLGRQFPRSADRRPSGKSGCGAPAKAGEVQ